LLVLGIESSCDETAAAVVADGRRVCSDVVASQAAVHALYGGVVPEVASRHHLETVVPTLSKAITDAGISWNDLDGIAVTCGPGLVGALLVGVEAAKALGYALSKPVVGVHHHAGHMAAAFLSHEGDASPGPERSHVALLVSGGHTALVRVSDDGAVSQVLGVTRDDAAGEAFDKTAKLLGLGYPGGVLIDKLAVSGDPKAHAFPRAFPARESLEFSFSGLKTSLATFLNQGPLPTGQALADVCASFQAAVIDVLVRKSRRALAQQGLKDLLVCGGVAANQGLRTAMLSAAAEDGFRLHIPPVRYCTDNAAMIAAAGTRLLKRGIRSGLDLNVDPGLPLP